eukprot:CAMPEP_0175129754 /NCGR_PEP_ID=MMETSP0087-20121206/5641_1 /TAXON_ID=136419 /ORGANISM="Unknown Unknown, Strain D1" /LENGTH=856 /DNA_ID=CAMNT_0016411925 /DNA_START=63 /DNA_END=2630 /DNA_ORIENTATION=+
MNNSHQLEDDLNWISEENQDDLQRFIVQMGLPINDCLEGKELNREKLNLRGREAMKKHQYRKMMQLQNPNFYKKGRERCCLWDECKSMDPTHYEAYYHPTDIFEVGDEYVVCKAEGKLTAAKISAHRIPVVVRLFEDFLAFFEHPNSREPVLVVLCCAIEETKFVLSVNPTQTHKSKSEIGLKVWDSWLYITLDSTKANEIEKALKNNRIPPNKGFTKPHQVCGEQFDIFNCGHDYFSDLADALNGAKATVMICDWFMTPQIYLKRDTLPPPQQFRLDNLLQTVASRGVQVKIILFQAYSNYALYLGSEMVKAHLEALSPNIKVLLHYPYWADAFWSHHQKLVVVDYEVAYVGGIDLCAGRYDLPSHPLKDNVEPYRFIGIDYYNVEQKDPCTRESLSTPFRDVLKRDTQVRQPWQDIQVKVQGLAARDVAFNFVQRWIAHSLVLHERAFQPRKGVIMPSLILKETRNKAEAALASAQDAYNTAAAAAAGAAAATAADWSPRSRLQPSRSDVTASSKPRSNTVSKLPSFSSLQEDEAAEAEVGPDTLCFGEPFFLWGYGPTLPGKGSLVGLNNIDHLVSIGHAETKTDSNNGHFTATRFVCLECDKQPADYKGRRKPVRYNTYFHMCVLHQDGDVLSFNSKLTKCLFNGYFTLCLRNSEGQRKMKFVAPAVAGSGSQGKQNNSYVAFSHTDFNLVADLGSKGETLKFRNGDDKVRGYIYFSSNYRTVVQFQVTRPRSRRGQRLPSPSSAAPGWVCPACTFSNSFFTEKCSVLSCGHTRVLPTDYQFPPCFCLDPACAICKEKNKRRTSAAPQAARAGQQQEAKQDSLSSVPGAAPVSRSQSDPTRVRSSSSSSSSS